MKQKQEKLKKELIEIARDKISNKDVSHDFQHAIRVLKNAMAIVMIDGGDLDVIIPAALFHDLIVYPKDSLKTIYSQKKSAESAGNILNNIETYPKHKIDAVKICILECSFSKEICPQLLESKILQDADGLEATGAISIMRTFSSAGQMENLFYDENDPFCKGRLPNAGKFAIDLFYERLLVVENKMHTEAAKKIAKRRIKFLLSFLEELDLELAGK